MANFEFSAPEQLTKESKAAPTMDIYAIGQLCQWYETGKIHKGTNRQRIENRDIDQIIEKCLADEPNERPQTIKEIRELIKKILN